MTAFIASVRLKRTGEVFYRIKGQLRSWTSVRSEASHFPTRDEAERSIAHTPAATYDKFVGTAREVADQIDGARLVFVAAVREKGTGRVKFRVAPSYPHLGEGAIWTPTLKEAHRFDSEEAAERVVRLLNDNLFEKKVGTPSQVAYWAATVDTRNLQDVVNASVKRLADFYQAPALFVHHDFDVKAKEVETPEADHTAGSNDLASLDIIETYIEKAQKIEEEGADEFTWRGFLHAFLKDILEAGK